MRAREPGTAAPEHPATARELIASVVADAQRLVRLELELARQEAKELAIRNAVAAGLLAVGGILLLLGLLVALPVLVIEAVPWKWQAAAVWLGACILIGVVLVVVGKARLQLRLPPRTIESLKESKEWALRRVRSNGR